MIKLSKLGRGLSLRNLVLGGTILAVVVSALVVIVAPGPGSPRVLGAHLSASSSQAGHLPDSVVDGSDATATTSASDGVAEWRPIGNPVGSWINLDWSKDTMISRIVVTRSTESLRKIASGMLSFSDGSSLLVSFPADKNRVDVNFFSRSATSARFTVTGLARSATEAAIAELQLFGAPTTTVPHDENSGGNAAANARVTASSTASTRKVEALIDTPLPTKRGDVGSTWLSSSAGTGSWVQLTWGRQRQLSSMQLTGSAQSLSSIRTGRIEFSDGSFVPVAAVLSDRDRPTTVAFAPRSVTSARFVVSRASGPGAVALSEIAAYDSGATPPRFAEAVPASRSTTIPATSCNTAGSAADTIVVVCPKTDASINGTATISVTALGIARVKASILPGVASQATSDLPVVSAIPNASTGAAELVVDASMAPHGPFTVRLQGYESAADGSPPISAAVTYLELYNAGGKSTSPSAPGATPPVSAPSAGMTLAYDDEFTSPVSLSRTGSGADYTASKPAWNGAQEFGDAIFADPALDLGNVSVVGDDYLRLTASARPASLVSPDSRAYIGGIIASSRVGGSGFSAQYGYFEARMYSPAGVGTWPAFWMLPAGNLAAAAKTVAEIDAVEIYGHNPVATCHATHAYISGTESKNIHCDTPFSSVEKALRWHTYGVRVAPGVITYYIDGAVVATIPQVAGGDQPMFFMVNMQLGGGWPIDLSAIGDRTSLYVDYVRVYT